MLFKRFGLPRRLFNFLVLQSPREVAIQSHILCFAACTANDLPCVNVNFSVGGAGNFENRDLIVARFAALEADIPAMPRLDVVLPASPKPSLPVAEPTYCSLVFGQVSKYIPRTNLNAVAQLFGSLSSFDSGRMKFRKPGNSSSRNAVRSSVIGLSCLSAYWTHARAPGPQSMNSLPIRSRRASQSEIIFITASRLLDAAFNLRLGYVVFQSPDISP